MAELTQSPMRLYTDTVDPTVNEDSSNGYEIGNWWRNSSTLTLFQCDDDSVGAAIWNEKPTLETGTFIPEIQFGGASIGVAYVTQSGSFVRVGNAVTINITISLSNKGTSVGSVTLINLPYPNGNDQAGFTIYTDNIALTTLYTIYGSRISPAQQFIRLFETGSLLGIQNLTDVSFQNDSQLFVSGTYFM